MNLTTEQAIKICAQHGIATIHNQTRGTGKMQEVGSRNGQTETRWIPLETDRAKLYQWLGY